MAKNIIKSVLFVFIFNSILYSASNQQTFVNFLAEEQKSGKITETESIVYQLQAIFYPQELPAKYQAVLPGFSRNATSLKLQLFNIWPGLSAQQQAQYQHYFNRPAFERLEQSLVSPNGLFKIHYTRTGPDAASEEFIANVAESFDYAYHYEVNILGYMPPPIDDPDNPEYDVYIYNFGDYGASTPESPVLSTSRDDYTGWIEMDNDFTHTMTKGLGAIQVTAAHELFHLIQFGYRVFMNTETSSIFLFEATAAWMEDIVYNDVNDYYYYLPYFFNHPYYSFSHLDGAHEYAMSIFFHFLKKKYGRSITKKIWEEFVRSEPYDAIEQALAVHGSNFDSEMAEFAIWNYFTGARADTSRFFPEGNHYPQLKEQASYTVNQTLSVQDEVTQLGINYYRIGVSASGDFTIQPAFSEPQHWIYAVIVAPLEAPVTFSYCGGNGIKNLYNVRALSDLLFIPIYTKKPTSSVINNTDFTVQLNRGRAPQLENKLVSVFPNPAIFSQCGHVNILFQLKNTCDDVKVTVFNEEGQVVNKVSIGKKPDGINNYLWNGKNDENQPVPSGIYLFLIEADEFIGPGKIALIR